MPLPHLVTGVKFRCSGSQGSGEFGMIFHLVQGSGSDITDTDASTFATHISTAWASDIAPIINSSTILTSVVVEGLGSASDGVGAWAGTIPGTLAGEPLPAQVCVLEKDTVALRYRGGHPRHYWPAPTALAMSDPTHLTTTAQSYWNAAVSSFHTSWITEAQSLWGALSFYTAVSYYSGHAPRSSPLIMPIVGYNIENMVATQRRRVGR